MFTSVSELLSAFIIRVMSKAYARNHFEMKEPISQGKNLYQNCGE
jgi:hypothetical protein